MDRSKTGTKRAWLVEGGGVPVGLSVTGANRHDFKRLQETLQSLPIEPPAARDYRRHLCLDKGDDFEEVRHLLHAYGLVARIRSRGEQAQAKKRKRGQKARRWLVERTHSWMNRFRRILTRWGKQARNYLAMLCFVCGLIAYRATLSFRIGTYSVEVGSS